MARTRVVLVLDLDHDGGAPIDALIFQLEGESIRDPESQLPVAVIDSATLREAEAVI